MKLSKFTIFLAVYIIVSGYYMNEVFEIWKIIFGKNNLKVSFAVLCLWAAGAIIYRGIKAGLALKRIILISAICLWGFIFGWKQPYLSEKVHLLEYGALAWLAMQDLTKGRKRLIECVLYAFIFIMIAGSLDEGFQKLLPWRYFEARDIATNIVSGTLGIILFCFTKR